MRRSLERSDTLINLRNQEISALNSRLAAKEETIAEAADQFDRLDQEVTQLRSQLETERADREEIEAQLSDLKQKSATAGDSTEKAPKILSLIKPWLSPKAPKNLLSKLEEVLEDD